MLQHRLVYPGIAVYIKHLEFCPFTHRLSFYLQTNSHNNNKAMSSLGEIQTQLSALFTTIKAQGFKLEDVLPQEMQDHFQDMTALKDARGYIKEIEAQEKELHAANATLKAQLQAKQAEIDDQPAEFKALEVELQQAKRRIDYYKAISEHEQARADRCERKLKEVTKLQTAAEDDARKIQRLQKDVADREASAFKLLEQNRSLTAQYEAELERSAKLIEEKDNAIFALRHLANRLEAEKIQVDESSEEEIGTYGSLLETLEQEKESSAQVANSKTVMFYSQQEFNDKLYSTITSELIPLNRFFDQVIDILAAYQNVFKDISDPHSLSTTRIPQDIYTLLDIADEHICAYEQISADLQANSDVKKYGLAQEAVVNQVGEIAKAAGLVLNELNIFTNGMRAYLERARSDSKPWRFGFGGSGLLMPTPSQSSVLGSSAVTPTQSVASSRSSISSFSSSFAKRFSTSA